ADIPDAVRRRYDGGWIRGPRITRLEGDSLGYFRLDAETSWELGTNNVGVFIGECQPLGVIIERLKLLERNDVLSKWVIVAATKMMAAEIVRLWFQDGMVDRVAVTTLKLPLVRGNIVLATPESLRR